ncbi:MAG: hypothetical protein HZT40_08575 [Candidatus Thiothrix singaporensis]|uniref:Uncharacterized protein n=1 Tax=Candidatus Thiothrix singaporensis TaxID=2799669 RepID=A0A7L6ARD0_9GAMM|nr:MAG: hypothetical protein HZT40_08575 [Candidatus Thiothrix singaporensis]
MSNLPGRLQHGLYGFVVDFVEVKFANKRHDLFQPPDVVIQGLLGFFLNVDGCGFRKRQAGAFSVDAGLFYLLDPLDGAAFCFCVVLRASASAKASVSCDDFINSAVAGLWMAVEAR